jgi:hypothetical protein
MLFRADPSAEMQALPLDLPKMTGFRGYHTHLLGFARVAPGTVHQ